MNTTTTHSTRGGGIWYSRGGGIWYARGGGIWY